MSRPDAAVLSAEYEVISTAKGPDGEQVSVLTTNQTHTAVENLRPESRCVCQGLLGRTSSWGSFTQTLS